MSLSLKERFSYNFFLWLFGLTKVRMINFVSPRIVDIDDTKAVINVPLNIKTRNHVKSLYIGSMVVGVDLVVGFSAYLQTKKKIDEMKRPICIKNPKTLLHPDIN